MLTRDRQSLTAVRTLLYNLIASGAEGEPILRWIEYAAFVIEVLAVSPILGGLAWAGVMGLLNGPVLMLLLVTTVEIYAERYAHEDRNLLGEALSRLGNDRGASAPEAGAPEAEAGQETATTTRPTEGTDRVEAEDVEQTADA